MRIESLRVRDFRNIRELELNPCAGANVIWGDNAQGKTNLLEAAWLFSGAKSFRGARDADYIPFGGGRLSLELDFNADNRPQSASIVQLEERKAVHLNGVKQERLSSIAGAFCTVVFSPDYLSLVKGGPDNRRRMIDAALSQAYPKYGKILDSYEKTLRQRNRLLKDITMSAQLIDTLDAWDIGLIEYGAYITRMRARYVARLAELAAEAYDGISLGKEVFSAKYIPSFGESVEGFEKSDYRDRLEKAVRESRAADIKNGVTSAGPHRDDVELMVGGAPARAFGSQGQQRSCVLAVKLAECRILEERSGEPPVVLLDDVMSELDEGRRGYLLNRLGERQVLITCCDPSAFSGLDGGRVFQIRGGELVP